VVRCVMVGVGDVLGVGAFVAPTVVALLFVVVGVVVVVVVDVVVVVVCVVVVVAVDVDVVVVVVVVVAVVVVVDVDVGARCVVVKLTRNNLLSKNPMFSYIGLPTVQWLGLVTDNDAMRRLPRCVLARSSGKCRIRRDKTEGGSANFSVFPDCLLFPLIALAHP
ncbi:MAG: hypothetical protein ACPG4A_07120, partial [Pseudomonadales bacterium]